MSTRVHKAANGLILGTARHALAEADAVRRDLLALDNRVVSLTETMNHLLDQVSNPAAG
jgi:t-SNARE complex subunit (syntaxin)